MSTPPPYLPPEPPASHGTPPGVPPVPPAAPKGNTGSDFFRWVRGLGTTRSSDRWIGGVAGGIAARLGVDPLLVRGVFFVAAMLGGAGFVLYGLAWALLPEPDGRIHVQQLLRGHFDSAIVGSALFVIAGIGPSNAIDAPWGDGAFWGALRGIGWLVTIGLLIWLFTSRRTEMTGWWKNVAAQGTVTQDPAGPGAAGGPAAGPAGTPGASGASGASGATGPSAPGTVGPHSSGAIVDPSAVPNPLAVPPASSAWGSPATFSATSASVGDTTQDQGFGANATASSAVVMTKPKPAKVKPTGPGRRTIAVVIGLSILAVAGVLLATRTGLIEADWKPLAFSAVLVIIGLGIVISGLRGRTSGTLGFLAIVTAITLTSSGVLPPDWTVSYSVGDRDYAWTERADAATGVDLGAGNATVDLTSVPLTSEPLTVPIHVGAGEVTVILPDDAAVLTTVDVRAGEITWEADGEVSEVSGSWTGQHEEQRSAGLADDGEAQLIVEVRLNAGNVTIQGENS